MTNMVENNYKYAQVLLDTQPLTIYTFEKIAEMAEIDKKYSGKELGELIGGSVSAAALKALVNRGMMLCEVSGKNYYAITAEIHEYYNKIYLPSKEHYMSKFSQTFGH